MPIHKSDLGVHGEHLLADDNGMLPDEGETLEDLSFAIHPAEPGKDRHANDHGGSPILYDSEEHYLHSVATARTRAANAAKLASEVQNPEE